MLARKVPTARAIGGQEGRKASRNSARDGHCEGQRGRERPRRAARRGGGREVREVREVWGAWAAGCDARSD